MSDHKPTTTQPRPNISTEHQEPGDARRPGDTLDQDEGSGNAKTKLEDRPNVGTVKPEDYPADQRGGGTAG